VEKTLADLGLGVRGSVAFPLPGPDRSNEPPRRLTFGKFANQWILAVETDVTDHHSVKEEWEWHPLLSSSRELRSAAVKVLPALVTMLAERTENDATALDDTNHELAALVAEMGAVVQAGGPPPDDDGIPF
jgi:hypothetical protein